MKRQLRLDLSSDNSIIFHCLPSVCFCAGLMEAFFFFPSGKRGKEKNLRHLFCSKEAVSIVNVCK